MRVIFSGGGTLGPVMPLLAVYQELKALHPRWQFLWVGTPSGPEKEVMEKAGLSYASLTEAKWRRYWSWRNFGDIFKFVWAFLNALFLVARWRPDLMLTAGGFVSVPLHLAGRIFGVKELVHQEDLQVGLANKMMAKMADYITTSLELSVKEFPVGKTVWLGNPVRVGIGRGNREVAIKHFNLEPNLTTVLVLGGGTGALSLNKIIVQSLNELVDDCQVIHMLGQGKVVTLPRPTGESKRDELIANRYHPVLFLEEDLLAQALAAADLVICRAGFSTLSELSFLAKSVVLVPLPNGHQEANAEYFSSRSGCPVYFSEREERAKFVNAVKKLLADEGERKVIGHDLSRILPKDARQKMAFLVEEVARKLGKL